MTKQQYKMTKIQLLAPYSSHNYISDLPKNKKRKFAKITQWIQQHCNAAHTTNIKPLTVVMQSVK